VYARAKSAASANAAYIVGVSSKPSVAERHDEPLVRIARAAARVLDAPLAVIAAREGGELRIAGAHGSGTAGLAGLQRLVTAVGTGADPEEAARAAGIAAWTSVPVGGAETPDATAGLLLVADRRARGWAEAGLQHLGDLAGVAADALHRGSERAREAQLRQVQRIESVVQLAGGIAHDFNNLLTAILGSAEILLEEGDLPGDAREDIEQIRKAATRAAQLTHQLLAFSRRQVLQPRLLDLNLLVEETARLLRRVLGEAVELETELAPGLDPVLADRAQIEQGIVDLALRARDAMPGGGRLRLATGQVTIHEAAAASGFQRGRYTTLEITDSGASLARDALDRVFEPFGPGGGESGLDLASIHGVVRQSGGYLTARSQPGGGTTFCILLPAVEHPAVAADAAIAAPADGGETILLVEDDEQVLKLAQRVLERAGYCVVTARDAQSATALANRHPGIIHLLVVDMMLPGLSGRELAAQLTIHRPAIKVLYISGTTDDAIARHRVLSPGTEFLQKPFALGQLLQRVRKVLDAPLARS
jgi:signal transduction histidine kinase/ActR/RegA family two-component response regulator